MIYGVKLVTNNIVIILLICRSPDVEEYTTSAAIIASHKFNEDLSSAEHSPSVAASAEDKPQSEEKVSFQSLNYFLSILLSFKNYSMKDNLIYSENHFTVATIQHSNSTATTAQHKHGESK